MPPFPVLFLASLALASDPSLVLPAAPTAFVEDATGVYANVPGAWWRFDRGTGTWAPDPAAAPTAPTTQPTGSVRGMGHLRASLVATTGDRFDADDRSAAVTLAGHTRPHVVASPREFTDRASRSRLVSLEAAGAAWLASGTDLWTWPAGARAPTWIALPGGLWPYTPQDLAATDGAVWIATRGGVARLADGRWTTWPEPLGITELVTTPDGALFAWGGTSLWWFRPGEQDWKRIRHILGGHPNLDHLRLIGGSVIVTADARAFRWVPSLGRPDQPHAWHDAGIPASLADRRYLGSAPDGTVWVPEGEPWMWSPGSRLLVEIAPDGTVTDLTPYVPGQAAVQLLAHGPFGELLMSEPSGTVIRDRDGVWRSAGVPYHGPFASEPKLPRIEWAAVRSTHGTDWLVVGGLPSVGALRGEHHYADEWAFFNIGEEVYRVAEADWPRVRDHVRPTPTDPDNPLWFNPARYAAVDARNRWWVWVERRRGEERGVMVRRERNGTWHEVPGFEGGISGMAPSGRGVLVTRDDTAIRAGDGPTQTFTFEPDPDVTVPLAELPTRWREARRVRDTHVALRVVDAEAHGEDWAVLLEDGRVLTNVPITVAWPPVALPSALRWEGGTLCVDTVCLEDGEWR